MVTQLSNKGRSPKAQCVGGPQAGAPTLGTRGQMERGAGEEEVCRPQPRGTELTGSEHIQTWLRPEMCRVAYVLVGPRFVKCNKPLRIKAGQLKLTTSTSHSQCRPSVHPSIHSCLAHLTGGQQGAGKRGTFHRKLRGARPQEVTSWQHSCSVFGFTVCRLLPLEFPARVARLTDSPRNANPSYNAHTSGTWETGPIRGGSHGELAPMGGDCSERSPPPELRRRACLCCCWGPAFQTSYVTLPEGWSAERTEQASRNSECTELWLDAFASRRHLVQGSSAQTHRGLFSLGCTGPFLWTANLTLTFTGSLCSPARHSGHKETDSFRGPEVTKGVHCAGP